MQSKSDCNLSHQIVSDGKSLACVRPTVRYILKDPRRQSYDDNYLPIFKYFNIDMTHFSAQFAHLQFTSKIGKSLKDK